MKKQSLSLALSLFATVCFAKPTPDAIERGRYLVQITGCNDCHTEGYMPTEGKIPESEWLKGATFGWSGPWGTTYATNLRLYMQDLSEEDWLQRASTLRARPPMPWFSLNKMHEADLRALYRYIRSLPVAGQAAPAYLPPDAKPQPPFAVFPPPPPTP